MLLAIRNKSRSNVAIGGRVGTLRPSSETSITLTIAELEALRLQLSALEAADLIVWDTLPTDGSTDNEAEGATVAYVDSQVGGGGGSLSGDVTGASDSTVVEGIWGAPIPEPGTGQGVNRGFLRYDTFPTAGWTFVSNSFDSGDFSSTGTVGANASSVTPAADFPYQMVGNTVTIGGIVDVVVDAAAASAFRLSMPFANFGSANKAGGTAVGFDGTNYVTARIKSVFMTDQVEFTFAAPAAGTINFSFSLTYTLG